jgi:hypothetical protein
MTCLAAACCWIGGRPVGADDEKKAREPQSITVQVKELEADEVISIDEDITVDGDKKRRVIAVRMQMHDGLDEKIESILKEAGLKGEKLEKACKQIVAACKETCGARPGVGAFRRVMELSDAKTPQVIVVGPDGKQQKIELKRMQGAGPEGLQERIRVRVEKALEESGVKREDLEKVREALKKAGDAQAGILHGHIPQALRVHAARVEAAGKYMIGLSCMPVDDDLRKKLKLGEGVGLVVQSVFDDAPAKEAGIQQGDVLVKVGDDEVAGIEDLVEAVQEAGEAEKKLALTILRDGKKRTIQVAPGKSEEIEITVDAELEGQALEGLKKHLQIEGNVLKLGPEGIGEIGPGVITKWGMFKMDDSETESLKKQVEDLSRQVEELKKAIAKMKSDKD